MSFRYSRPLLSQNLATTLMLGAATGLLVLPGAQAAWAGLVGAVPEPVLFVALPTLAHLALYWTLALAFDQVDRHDRPAFIARYRIQQGPPRRPPWSRVLPNLALNQLLLSPLLLVGLWAILRARGWTLSPELPGPGRFLVEMVALTLCSLVWFYASHRFLHRPWWMKKVHRQHHEFRTTAAISSEYAHPVEFIFGNFLTLGLGVALLAPSFYALVAYTLLAIFTVLIHHCGYNLPWAPWSVHHDWHHYRYKEAFGTLGFIDRLLGTDAELATLEDGDLR